MIIIVLCIWERDRSAHVAPGMLKTSYHRVPHIELQDARHFRSSDNDETDEINEAAWEEDQHMPLTASRTAHWCVAVLLLD